ncbi:MAG: alanine racemase [Anaerorhabdus sp.]
MYRSSWLEIDLDAIRYNIRRAKETCKKEIICVIKANAYGVGDLMVSQVAIEEGINFFAVSSLEEAITLRKYGLKQQIIILGVVDPQHLSICSKHNITVTIPNVAWLDKLIELNIKNISAHLKVDTGMNRIGVKSIEEAKECLKKCLENDIKIDGIYTHFVSSDKKDQLLTHAQYNLFKKYIEELNYDFKYIHTSNSDAIFSFNDDICNAARLGISMFGISSFNTNLKNSLALYSKISMIKSINKGEFVGYGATYKAQEDEIIATIPFGYADGLNRRYKGHDVSIDGKKEKIVGNICMDQTMIKLSALPKDNKVEIFGKNITIAEISKTLDTIPYEIMTSISDRVTRVYIQNNKQIKSINFRLDHSLKIKN